MSENQVISIGANPSLHSAVSHFDFALIGNEPSTNLTFSASFLFLFVRRKLTINTSLVFTMDVYVLDSVRFRRKLMR